MKKSRLIGCLIGLTMIIPSGIFGQLKIGYIDSNRIMQEYEEVRDAQAKLEKETRRLQVEYSTYVERLDSLNREFERQRLLLSNEKNPGEGTGNPISLSEHPGVPAVQIWSRGGTLPLPGSITGAGSGQG